MKCKVKIAKRLISLLLVFLFSINTFAVVSNNDGSAFITKAEFDSLKNNFQSQIDSYNQGIDTKIDIAIASYLSGVSISQEPTNIYNRLMANTNNKFRWTSKDIQIGTSAASMEVDTVLNTRRRADKNVLNIYSDFRSHGSPGDDPTTKEAGVIFQLGSTAANAKGDATVLLRSYFYGSGYTMREKSPAWDAASDFRWKNYSSLSGYNDPIDFMNSQQISVGTGKLWDLNRLPNDNYELKRWNTKAYLSNVLTFNCYTWQDFYTYYKRSSDLSNFMAVYCAAGGMNTPGTTTLALSTGTGFSVTPIKSGTKPTSGEWRAGTNWAEGTQNLSWFKESDNIDYSFWYWGDNVNKTLYAITDEVMPNWSGLSQQTAYSTTDSYHTYTRKYYPNTGPENETVYVGRIKCQYYVPIISPVSYALSNISNSYASNIAGETLYHGNGIPCFTNMTENGKIKVKDMKFTMYTGNNTTPTTGQVKIMFSKNKFINGTYADAADKLYEEVFNITAATGEGIFTTSANFIVTDKNQMVWINVVDPTKADRVIKLESLDPVLDV